MRRVRLNLTPQQFGRQIHGLPLHQVLDLRVEAGAPARWPSISACLIVKDEAANLEPCLTSLRDLASEVVVVDTGSSDRTVQVAEKLGAAVHHFPWVDDFAAARNESLRHAHGDWIFWLDADDRLTPKAVAQWKRAAACGKAEAYSCNVCSVKANGATDVGEHIRLFRNGLGIHFTGTIHESVFPDLVRLGLRTARTDITVEHLGYADRQALPQKLSRNLAMIDRELEANPQRVDLLFYRGQCRHGLGDAEGAQTDLHAYLSSTELDVAHRFTRFWAYATLHFSLRDGDDLEKTRSLLEEALQEFPRHPHFLMELASLQLAAGQAREALKGVQAAMEALHGTVLGLRPSEASVEVGLAECCLALGEKQEALRWAHQARAHAPDSDRTAELLERAGRSTVPTQKQMRALALVAQGNPAKAAEAFAEAIQCAPTEPDNYRYLAMALKELGREADALEAWRLAAHWQARAPSNAAGPLDTPGPSLGQR